MHTCSECGEYVIFVSSSVEDRINELTAVSATISCSSINNNKKRKLKEVNYNIEIIEPVKKKQKY